MNHPLDSFLLFTILLLLFLSRTASGKDTTIQLSLLSSNFRKLKRIVIIFAKQHQQSKEKQTLCKYNESPPQLINAATLPFKMKCSASHYTTTQTKLHKKHFNSKSMFTMHNTAVNACWDTATVQCHWTEQWLSWATCIKPEIFKVPQRDHSNWTYPFISENVTRIVSKQHKQWLTCSCNFRLVP